MKPRILVAGLFVASMATAASAATINVPADQATVQGAVTAAVNGDEIVIAPGTYVGAVLVEDKSITLRGSDANNRPVLALGRTGGSSGIGFANSGMLIVGDGITVSVENLILIPDTANIPDRMVQTSTRNDAATITASFENILITGNAGSNVPSVTSVFDTATAMGTTCSSDGMYLVNRAFLTSLKAATGVYTLTDVTVIGAGRDGIVAFPNGAGSSLTASGVKIARSTRNYTQWGDDNNNTTAYTVTGTRANPGLLIINNTNAGSGNGVQGINGGGTIVIDHLVHLNNVDPYIITGGNVGSVTITDSLIAETLNDDGLAIYGGGDAPNIAISNTTFYNNGVASGSTAGLWFAAVEPTYTVTDCIFAAGAADRGGLVLNASVGARVTASNNAFVFAGANALTQTIFGSGAPVASETGTITADPVFSSTSVTSLADLTTAFDVTATAYATASSTADKLNGWGDGPTVVVTPTPLAAQAWENYQ